MKRWVLRLALLALPSLADGASAQLQRRISITDLGPGAAGRVLRDALGRPHKLVTPDAAPLIQRRGESESTSLIVLDRDAYIGGKVEGDVIIVNGDLFIRVGAEISGRAIAIGGGVYPSRLAYVGGGTQSFYDHTFDVASIPDGYRLAYRSLRLGEEPPLLFPGVYGFRIPSYDRVNGLSIPFGPSLTFAGGLGETNALATYRSDLGKFDPSLTLELQVNRRTRLEASAERGSFTNDRWILPDLINSGVALFFGDDTRNFYRADRGEATIHRVWETTQTTLEPFVGARYERSWSVGPVVGGREGPWSVFDRDDVDGMLRPNPQVPRLTIPSVLVGTTLRFEAPDLQIRARSQLEGSPGPTNLEGVVEGFSQVTSDLDVRFPTFGEQAYRVEVHWVTSQGTPPPQRFAYLGGSGTIPFLETLEQGGDELLLIDQRYSYPLTRVNLGIVGMPTLQLRHRMGSAGLGGLPELEQMLGIGVSLTVIRAELRIDPASRETDVTVGFTFAR